MKTSTKVDTSEIQEQLLAKLKLAFIKNAPISVQNIINKVLKNETGTVDYKKVLEKVRILMKYKPVQITYHRDYYAEFLNEARLSRKYYR